MLVTNPAGPLQILIEYPQPCAGWRTRRRLFPDVRQAAGTNKQLLHFLVKK